ncbi:hypothetical protein [Paludibacterium yongneupense]|uniref:hypothetical protein n=2 Tax=Paludibacterium yongneupense TaxID=400061 RepID=UPI0012EB482C|nr:hypothetical protein [Paludibacterium yongneupense]
MVSFTAGGFRFAMEARHVRGMSRTTEEGDADAGRLIGLPEVAGERRILHIGVEGRRVAVGGPVELSALPASRIFALPPLLAARLSLRGVRALALHDDGAVFIVDPASLLGE